MAAPKGFNPKIVGDRTCAMVLARLLQFYDTVLLPFGENQRYDLVVDTGSSFIRVQCKTGRLRNGVVAFATCSSTYHHPNRNTAYSRKDYRGEADVFGVYCPDNEGFYLVPVGAVGRRRGYLRVDLTKNSQSRRIRWARDFVVESAIDARTCSSPPPESCLFEGLTPYTAELGAGLEPAAYGLQNRCSAN